MWHVPYLFDHTGSDSGVVEARRSSVNSQFQRGHNRSRSSGTGGTSLSPYTTINPTPTTAKYTDIQRQSSAPPPSGDAKSADNMGFNEILDNLDQLTKQLEGSCSNPSSSNGKYLKTCL